MVNQKDQMVIISPAFLEHLIDTVCNTAQMYKDELKLIALENWMPHRDAAN